MSYEAIQLGAGQFVGFMCSCQRTESHNFYIKHSRLSIYANSFSRIGAKLWNEIPLSLRNLPKNAFNRKIKQNLTNILNAEDYYIDVPEIILKMKSFSVQIST